MAPFKSYSSLFTAGILSLGNRAGSTTKSIPSPVCMGDNVQAQTPTISVRPPPPPSPARKADPAPRRRRKSSVTLGSSPMAAIKSPIQRAQYSHRSAQRAHSIMVPSSPGTVLGHSTQDGVWTVQENHTLTRARRGRSMPPKQKPIPDVPLPNPPSASLSKPADSTGPPNLSLPRRDSETLPLPSPGLISGFNQQTIVSPLQQPLGFGGLLAPSPILGSFGRPRNDSIPEQMEEIDEREDVNMS
ncbi:hypothetical protein FRB93_011011 [Tulasnella sp. JGI-2019a]|nr:hypothetical protein FRB93_011011 [Tulasnella sp. JGI-2019a]